MPRFAANLSMMFTEVAFLDRFALAAKAGFEGVEYLFPYEFEPEALAAALRKHRLAQVLFNLPAGNWAGGERGIAILPDRVHEFRRGVDAAIGYAKELGCSQVNCLAGIAPACIAPDLLRTTFLHNLRYAAEALGEHGLRLLIEPVNRYDIPGFFLSTVEDAAEIIAATGSDNLFVQYDLYHQQRTRGELVKTFERFETLIRHVQLADNPGRNEPGTGEINFPNVFSALDEAGYGGWIGCEYRPADDTLSGLGWMPRAAGADRPASDGRAADRRAAVA